MLERCWSLLARDAAPCLHRRRWREKLGEETVATLERHHLLSSQGRDDTYPCQGFCGGRSLMHVLDTPDASGFWVAVCGDDEFSCADVRLTTADLERLAFSPPALASWLQKALGTTGSPLRFAQHKGVEGLGRLVWEGEERAALLFVGSMRLRLPVLLGDLLRLPTPSVVFVPSLSGVDGGLLARHAPSAHVVLADLGALVAMEGGRLVLVPARSGPQRVLPVREPAGAPYAAEPIVAEVFEATGKRGLSATKHAALVAQRASFDLFMDQTQPGKRRNFLASVRGADGALRQVALSAKELAVLVELVKAPGPLRLGQICSVSVRAPERLIERARGKIEGKAGRSGWRIFKTLAGVEEGAQRYAFQPPAGFRFAVVVPLEG